MRIIYSPLRIPSSENVIISPNPIENIIDSALYKISITEKFPPVFSINNDSGNANTREMTTINNCFICSMSPRISTSVGEEKVRLNNLVLLFLLG